MTAHRPLEMMRFIQSSESASRTLPTICGRWISTMEPFSFATSEALELPVSIRMSDAFYFTLCASLTYPQRQPRRGAGSYPILQVDKEARVKACRIKFEVYIQSPPARLLRWLIFYSYTSPHSDLYVTVQLWADSKPLTVPVQTAYKPFKNERK
jgi:phosphatidylinositol 3-kinase